MGLTTSLYTGLSGLTANSNAISLTGDNIANVNTTAYKSSQLRFETQIAQTFRPATPPSTDSGGTNPLQIGLGVRLGATSRSFLNGAIQPTAINTDLAIEGNGFFIVNAGGESRYTRAGNFRLDSDHNLVASDGAYVQGYGVDDQYQIIPGTLGNLRIPIGDRISELTTQVKLGGNLNAGGVLATQPAISRTGALTDFSTSLAATGASLLTNLRNTANQALFATGDVVTVSGVTRGGASLPDHTFEVGAANTTGSDDFGSTVQDFLDFMNQIFGIDTSVGGAGATINGSGQIAVQSNLGSANALDIDASDIVVNAGGSGTVPLDFSSIQDANGESVRTTFVAYDSLGNAMNVDLSMTLEARDNSGTTWRYFVQSEDDSDLARAVTTGTISFNNLGQIQPNANATISLDRAGTGAVTPQAIELVFNDSATPLSALADSRSQIAAAGQDGSPIGTLQDFSISEDGTVVGVYSNSLTRNLGQVVLANFANPQGLIEEGSNRYNVSVNSGQPTIAAPGTSGAGRVVGGALELSNVELSEEFINLITASTGFSASSRVLTTSDRLLQELLSSVR